MSNAGSPLEAINRFTDPLQKALSCVSRAVWVVGARSTAGPLRLTIPAGPVSTRTDLGPVYLEANLSFKVYHDGTQHRVRTLGYMYTISDSAVLETELISWHWHPPTRHRPHLHIKDLAHLGHVPTGRVTFESVLRYLIEDLAADPARKDWRSVLEGTELLHAKHRSWSVDPTTEVSG